MLGSGGMWGVLGKWDVEQRERRARGGRGVEEMKADKG